MKALSLEQMEVMEGGADAKRVVLCGFATVGLVTAFIGLTALTAGTSAFLTTTAVVGWVVAPTGWAATCFG